MLSVSLSLNAIMHGKTYKRNFWHNAVDTSIYASLLYCGGFFS